jgi:hypothetical protein
LSAGVSPAGLSDYRKRQIYDANALSFSPLGMRNSSILAAASLIGMTCGRDARETMTERASQCINQVVG